MAILPSITFLNTVAFLLFATIAIAPAFIAVWHLAKHKRFCFAFLPVLQPHCEQFSGKDCVIAFPANVCKSGPAGARAQSQPYDWCSVTWEMTRACQARSRGKRLPRRNQICSGLCVRVFLSRCVWPIVIQASERLATHVVLDASVAEGRAPPAPFTFPQKWNRKRQQASLLRRRYVDVIWGRIRPLPIKH